jgi:hypothetical protein
MDPAEGLALLSDIMGAGATDVDPEEPQDQDPDAGFFFQVRVYIPGETLTWRFPIRGEAKAWRDEIRDTIEDDAGTVEAPDGDLLACNKISAVIINRYRS